MIDHILVATPKIHLRPKEISRCNPLGLHFVLAVSNRFEVLGAQEDVVEL